MTGAGRDENGQTTSSPGGDAEHFATRRRELSRLVFVASSVSGFAVVAYVSFTAIFAPEPPYMYGIAGAYGLGSVLTALAIYNQRSSLGATIFVTLNSAAATAFLIAEGSDTGHFGIFFVGIILAGLLLSSRAAVVTGVLAALATGGVVVAVTMGFEPPGHVVEGANWSKQVAQLLVAGILTALVTRGLHRALGRLHEQQTTLERKNAELQSGRAQLEHSRRRAAALVELSPDGVVVVDASGTLVEANRAALEVLGGDCVGKDIRELGWLSASDKLGRLVEPRTLELGEPALVLELRGAPVDSLDETMGWQVTIRDDTARVAAQKRQAALENEHRRAQRLEMLGSLAGGIAHDFNNLLTVIMASADAIVAAEETSDEIRSDATEIARAGASAARVTGQLLSLSGRRELGPVGVDVGQLVSDEMPLLRRLVGAHVAIETEITQGTGTRVDRAQLEQVLLNLVINAQDALTDGGTIRVRVARETEPPGGGVVLEVSDDGPGIPPEILERIFQPFFSTKADGRGTGLGLALIERIITDARGSIGVTSEPGQGTTFRVVLPYFEGGLGPADALRAAFSGPVGNGEHIIVVEDEQQIRKVTRTILERAGYVVTTCADGNELERCLELGTQFDMLLTDVILPHLSGPALVKKIRERGVRAPVVYMSGYTGGFLSQQGVGIDVQLLSKPFSAQQLLEQVAKALRSSTSAPESGLPKT